VRLIGVSLDGPKEIHNEIRRDPGAYDKLVDAIDKMNRHKREMKSTYPRLNLNAVILKKNFDKLESNIDLAKEKDVSSCSFQIYDPSWDRSAWRLSDEIASGKKTIEEVEPIDRGKLKEALEKLLKKAKEENVSAEFMPCLSLGEVVDYYDNEFDLSKWYCLNPWSTARISPYGDVFPCLNFKIGNIREEKLAKLWNGPKYRRFRRSLGKVGLFDSCAGCCKMERK
jgi:MoaA/NifB/PqqE/SkfB family radical SAM enzyme